MKCRHCKTELELEFLNLGNAPPSNAYLNKEDLRKPEITYPLRILTCTNCWLVQTEDYTDADELFNDDYAYFSSTSKSWLKHASDYCTMITNRLGLSDNSFVVEIASNDGYLLKNFVSSGIPCLGIEPTKSTAAAASAIGVPVRQEFFGKNIGLSMANAGEQADLVLGNNVFAHVPDINDFTEGVADDVTLGDGQLDVTLLGHFGIVPHPRWFNRLSVGIRLRLFGPGPQVVAGYKTGVRIGRFLIPYAELSLAHTFIEGRVVGSTFATAVPETPAAAEDGEFNLCRDTPLPTMKNSLDQFMNISSKD